jgi:hypothetical protein
MDKSLLNSMLAWLTGDRPAPAPVPAPAPFTHPPVFIQKANTVVSWSPKAGCSHVVFWAFVHEGCLPQAAAESHLPHKYRIDTYQKEQRYRLRLGRLRRGAAPGHTLVKITRDPKCRLVSIFRHACRRSFLHELVRTTLGFDPATEGFALADLDALLGQLKLTYPTRADPHLRVQESPLWTLPFDRVITLNMDEIPLNDGLNAVERVLGLPQTDFTRLAAFRRLRKAHYARERAFDASVPLETYRFRPHETKAFPKRELMASPLLERMARRHYAADYAGVGSGDTAGELFQPASVLVAR